MLFIDPIVNKYNKILSIGYYDKIQIFYSKKKNNFLIINNYIHYN